MRTDAVDIGPKDIFLQSLERCERHGGFLQAFYGRFMDSSPLVREKFRDTDFDRQRRMLGRSLRLIARATAGEPEGLAELHARAETHSRVKLDIEPQLYALWLEALIGTAAGFDPEWDARVEVAWREILSIAIRHMARHYEAPID